MNDPKISVLLVSHEKPDFCKSAIASVQAQTLESWQLFVVDSGKLHDSEYFDHHVGVDDRVWIEKSNEPADLAQRLNPHSWVANRVLCSGRLKGELILLLCDDDIFYPWAFEAIWRFYKETPGRECLYGSVHLGKADTDGVTDFVGERRADVARGRFIGGPPLDCQVDYLQFAFTQKALWGFRGFYGDEILPEGKEHQGHADGVFMEKMGTLMPVYAVPAWLGMNRRTPNSRFVGP